MTSKKHAELSGRTPNCSRSTQALSAVVSSEDGCVLRRTKTSKKPYFCELSVRVEKKKEKHLIPVVKDLLSLFLSFPLKWGIHLRN